MREPQSYADRLLAHYGKAWGSPPISRRKWTRGPLGKLPTNFEIAAFKRTSESVALATVGMSSEGNGERLELHLVVAPQFAADDRLVELLTTVAHFHVTERRLGLNHSVNFGGPWIPGSSCDHGLISLPYLDGPSVEVAADIDVRCLWLIPITKAEVALKISKGIDALEEQFEKKKFNYLDPFRESVTALGNPLASETV